ncbi:MAG: ATP-binding cassette domain-containing protein [Alphaproteobacteria bacterium]|nr:ATP-binding cassette domain-containing protein [Alphaproteobacteria bacterium]
MGADAAGAVDDAVRLEGVTKSFGGFTAVRDLSFAVPRGEIFGFLGPNGAGKTTTLRMILNIIEPTGGRIDVLGRPSTRPQRARVGYLPEERGLYRKMRAAESIAYFARLRGMPARDAIRRASELLNEFGLGEFERSRNEALSKGMAQKVQLLAAIAHDPEFLILDEPFSGLDPINQGALEELIRSLRARGKTIIFSTHVMEHAERLCDRFLIIARGRKRFEGTLEQARESVPQPIALRTRASPEELQRLAGVRRAYGPAADGEFADRNIELEPGVDPQSILAAIVSAGIAVKRFDASAASLHDIFVKLASEEPDAE